ncbi:Fur family transcriptional regulator [Falsiporphyromonas endometrii]|uniref:Fur family transcriptional regulator n=1 Tax=Falsiporphyromonas endometrii TaxID=1387297 RepID=A0ABV9K9R6_9PORP
MSPGNQEYVDKLKMRGIRPTSNRILVLRAMMDRDEALSIMDIETILDTVDKSTIFRTITLFHAQHLIHSIDDGSGSLKYAVCDNDCTCSVEDQHTHFRCEICQRTFCFDHIHVPKVKLPDGFVLDSINYVMKGICPDCVKKKKR